MKTFLFILIIILLFVIAITNVFNALQNFRFELYSKSFNSLIISHILTAIITVMICYLIYV